MHNMIFVNLPVADTERTRAFFAGLGYDINERFSQPDTCVAVQFGENIFAMFLHNNFFDTFHHVERATTGQLEVLNCLACDSRDEVDRIADQAVSLGGHEQRPDRQEENDNGDYMYGRTITDLDGHVWELLWMDVEKAAAAGAIN